MNCGCDEQMAFTLTEQFASGLFDEACPPYKKIYMLNVVDTMAVIV